MRFRSGALAREKPRTRRALRHSNSNSSYWNFDWILVTRNVPAETYFVAEQERECPSRYACQPMRQRGLSASDLPAAETDSVALRLDEGVSTSQERTPNPEMANKTCDCNL